MSLLFVLVMVVTIISLPVLAGFLIYRSNKNKYKTIRLLFLYASIILTIYVAYNVATVFDPEYEKVTIRQDIGGDLICNSVYISDHHSWQYDISYLYKINGNLLEIGNGTYYGREWKKNEQLIKFEDWIILKTGGWIGYDKILIINQTTKKTSEFEFTPENVEKDTLWKAAKIISLINYCCGEVFIDKIENEQIKLHYKYRMTASLTEKYDVKTIYYHLDAKTGVPRMTKIE